MSRSKGNKSFMIIILMIIAVMVISPLYIAKDAEFGGADGEAEGVILEIAPEYEPWFSPFLEPASGEIESMLFSLQAAFGSGIIFYILGYLKGKDKKQTSFKS